MYSYENSRQLSCEWRADTSADSYIYRCIVVCPNAESIGSVFLKKEIQQN